MMVPAISLMALLLLAAEPATENRWRPPAEAEPPHGREAGQSAAPGIGPGFCAAFADPDYRGTTLRVRDGQPLEWVGRAWDNRISSIACAPGCRFFGWQHMNYGGPRAVFSGSVGRVGHVFDERISAARVVCSPSRNP